MIFSLSDHPQQVRQTAIYELAALASFPENDEFRQARALIIDEYIRFTEATERYRPTDIGRAILDMANRRVGQKSAAGLMAIAMCQMHKEGLDFSQNNAAKIVSEYAFKNPKMSYLDWQDDGWVIKQADVPEDEATIKKWWRKHRHVAHVCAGQLIYSQDTQPEEPFELAQAAHLCSISTILKFQETMETIPEFKEHKFVRITTSYDDLMTDYPPLGDDGSMFHAVMAPWREAQAEKKASLFPPKT